MKTAELRHCIEISHPAILLPLFGTAWYFAPLICHHVHKNLQENGNGTIPNSAGYGGNPQAGELAIRQKTESINADLIDQAAAAGIYKYLPDESQVEPV